MKLYFKLHEGYADEVLKMVDPNNDINIYDYDYVYEVDTTTGKVKMADSAVPMDRIFELKSPDIIERFKKIFEGKELARFNDGKPQLSYVDFSLWFELPWDDVDPELKRLMNLASNLCFLEEKTPQHDNALKMLQRYALRYDPNGWDHMVKVLEYGAEKYERNNWRKPGDKCKIIDSLLRHLKCMARDEYTDADSGLPHIGHVLCNVMFYTYQLVNEGEPEG